MSFKKIKIYIIFVILIVGIIEKNKFSMLQYESKKYIYL